MSWKIIGPKPRSKIWIIWILLAVSAALIFGWPRIKHSFQKWSVKRQVQRAAEQIAQGDYEHAILNARSALAIIPMDVEATRVMAKALYAIESPAAVSWLSHLNTLQPGDLENTTAWALASLRIGDVASAERILHMLKPAQQDTAEFHGAAAKLSVAKHDSAGAEKHCAEACRLKPDDEGHRFALAIIRLGSKRPDEHKMAVEVLSEIGRKPPKSIEALRALLDDASKREEWKRAAEISDALVADPGARFEDKIRRLTALRAMKSNAASECLLELKNSALSNPHELYLLFMWMNQHSLSLLVSDWSRTLPPDVLYAQPTCVAVADAYARSAEWPRLRAYLEERSWDDLDYMRRAFLSRALERLDEGENAAQEWSDALSAARSRDDARVRLERIAKSAVIWNANQRAEEVMWLLTGFPDTPRWVLDALWTMCLERLDTPKLQKLAGLLAKADSKSVAFLKNYALFSLLIRSEDGNPHREAERLFIENPGNASVAMTWGLSLFQRGKIAEAIAVTGSLPSDALQRPQVALYHAIFLTAAGEGGKAAEFLAVAQDWKMFPEEKTLLDRAKTLATKAPGDSEIAAKSKALRAAKAARDLEAEKAVVAARAERTAKAAHAAQAAAQSPAPEKSGGRVPPR